MGMLDWLFGKKQDTACGNCSQPVKRARGSTPVWYDGDQVDWHCGDCEATFCGKCCTKELQKLKAKYKANGPELKRAIDNDQMAIVELWEVAPCCPRCGKNRALAMAGNQ